jgi:hypothetical protein
LHEAYLGTADSPATRARLAAALARSWVYGNDAARGAPFALEAVELAGEAHDPTVLADALDAQLATSWGPDDLSERLHITARLQDVAAHVDDVRTRMDGHLWRLTTALETLDVTGMHRQLSALDLLAGETGSPLVRYFAMTRLAMHATLVDDLDRARELVEAAYALGTDIGVPDALAVYHEQRAEIARHADDVGFLAGEAALTEDYAVRHGIESVIAEAAVLALQAGDTERASRLVLQVAGGESRGTWRRQPLPGRDSVGRAAPRRVARARRGPVRQYPGPTSSRVHQRLQPTWLSAHGFPAHHPFHALGGCRLIRTARSRHSRSLARAQPPPTHSDSHHVRSSTMSARPQPSSDHPHLRARTTVSPCTSRRAERRGVRAWLGPRADHTM